MACKHWAIGLVCVAGLMVGGCTEEQTKDVKKAASGAADSAKAATAGMVEKAKETGGKVVEAVTDQIKGQVTTYLDKLKGATTSLEGVKDAAGATGSLGAITKQIGEVSAASGVLNALPADLKTKVTEQFGPQIKTATDALKAQVERITKDGAMGGVLGEALKGLKFFQ